MYLSVFSYENDKLFSSSVISGYTCTEYTAKPRYLKLDGTD